VTGVQTCALPISRGIWFSALASAIIGTQVLVSFDIISFDSHRFFEAKLPLFAIAIGGLMFGTGMVLTKGCISRLIVLAGTGNMRALIVCIIFSISAHATLKGIFAPLRVWAGSFTIDMGEKVGFFNLIGGAPLWTVLIISFTFLLIYKSGAKSSHIILAILIGLLMIQVITYFPMYKIIFLKEYGVPKNVIGKNIAKKELMKDISNSLINDLKNHITKDTNILIENGIPFDFLSIGLSYHNIQIIYGPLQKSMFDLEAYSENSQSKNLNNFNFCFFFY
jgi:hypothetical protein